MNEIGPIVTHDMSMGVAAHLGIRVRDYDRRIRAFIPHYEAMLDAAAAVVATTTRAAPILHDLGIGSGALAARCLGAVPAAQIIGIDEDESMLALAHKRLGRHVTTLTGDFQSMPFPRCDVITASFALHHIAIRRQKARLYAKCHSALKPGGLLVNADCCLASDPALQESGRDAWHAHLRRSYSAAQASDFLRAWAKEDTYFTLDAELDLMRSAGFSLDVVWRRDAFAVVAGFKR
jgi:ubiquinone/menaquinone biosynthesis C-methylase UbiE